MKIIISRKGFDSSKNGGGVPSPIFPDGRMLSLPIPDRDSSIKYSAISWNNYNVGDIVSNLTNKRICSDDKAHLDPDLNENSFPRKPGWRPIFGQGGAAQGHLKNQGVDEGDIFLFFGLFREVEQNSNGEFEFKQGTSRKHVMWGWMQIDKKIRVANGTGEIEEWAGYHPHLPEKDCKSNNTVYIAKDYLELPGKHVKNIKGAGVFEQFDPDLQLTRKDHQVTLWKLPLWFYDKKALTYHPKLSKDRWQSDNSSTLLQSTSRGQEFVLDTDDYPEAIGWVQEILEKAKHANSQF